MTQQSNHQEEKCKLIGMEIVLDPKKSGMFYDPINKIALGFGSGKVLDKGKAVNASGSDKFTFSDGMDPVYIERAIKAGVLRVMKDGKDMSEKFGGPKISTAFKGPIVEGAIKPPAKSDIPLLRVLALNNQTEIIRQVRSLKNYAQLERLKELEEMGKNPSSHARVNVLDIIVDEMKTVPGVGEAREIHDGKEDKITLK
jgi:hypothetical protein